MLIPPHVPGMHAMLIDVPMAQADRRPGGLASIEPAVLNRLVTAYPAPTNVRRLDRTWTGEDVVMPAKVRILQFDLTLPPGKRLPVHLHPYPRVAEVLGGRLRVVQAPGPGMPARERLFETGDTIVESINRFHHGEVVGDTAVRLRIRDYLPADLPQSAQANTIYRDPCDRPHD